MQHKSMTPTLLGVLAHDIKAYGSAYASVLAVIRELAQESEPTNLYVGSYADLAKHVALSHSQVGYVINKLIDAGALERVSVSNRWGTTYKVVGDRRASKVVSR